MLLAVKRASGVVHVHAEVVGGVCSCVHWGYCDDAAEKSSVRAVGCNLHLSLNCLLCTLNAKTSENAIRRVYLLTFDVCEQP